MMYGHTMTPNQASPSTSMPHNEDFEMGSPPWPRTPASPVFNSPPAVPPPESFRSTKATVRNVRAHKIFLFVNIYSSYSFTEIR